MSVARYTMNPLSRGLPPASPRALAGQTSWTDYAAQARVKPLVYNGTVTTIATGAVSVPVDAWAG
jgi:hypothetical protein